MASAATAESDAMTTQGQAFVGVSGFGYPSWRGGFYPETARPPDFLGLYSAQLPSVELNATGRRFPSVEQLRRWADVTPATFKFAVKLTAAVTARPATAERFCSPVRSLNRRLGTILVPLPALGRHDAELARSLFAALAPDLRYAVELKNDAWNQDDVRELASHLRAVIVNHPMDDPGFSYFRFREPPYSGDALVSIAATLYETVAAGRDAYAYFRHEDEPTGPRYARAVFDLLETRDRPSEQQI